LIEVDIIQTASENKSSMIIRI